MTAADRPSEAVAAEPPVIKARKRSRLRRAAAIAAVVLGVLALLLVGTLVGVRYGVVSDPGRQLLVDLLQDRAIGRYGRLRLQGLRGDVFGDFTVERLTVTDSAGVWLEARNVRVDWNARALYRRRFEADLIQSDIVRVFRRPIPEERPDTPDEPLPVSVDIDRLDLVVETLPALSRRRGVWEIAGEVHASRDNAWRGELAALSELRPGDGLTAGFRFGEGGFGFTADGREAAGGALAGLLGLPADQPFALRARGHGGADAGSVEAVARSGERLPAFAVGSWSEGGGQVSGRVELEAFNLLRSYARQVGPQVDFDLRLGADRAGVREAALRVAAANATVAADGPVNLDARTTPGLRTLVTVRDLSRVAELPAKGAARVEGLFSGGLSAWRFAGDVAADRVEAGSQYRLQRVSGPVVVNRDAAGTAVSGRLQGAGGQGVGLAAAWLGGAPRATFDIRQLADGRLLVRNLEAVGPGLRLNASGERGLLGGLNFSGDLQLSNLAAARPGARGVLTADWSASRRSGPWSFTVDARGRELFTGLAQLDGLLGRTPRLQARGTWADDNTLSLADARLDAAKFDATARGPIQIGGPLNLALTWRAQGPFAAGPVEIAGALTGDGRVTGTLTDPRADLNARVDAVDLPQLALAPVNLHLVLARAPEGFTGRIEATAGSAYGPASLNTQFAFAGDGIDLRDLQLNAGGVRAAGSVALRDGQPSLADLTFAAGPGAFLEAGTAEGRLRVTQAGGAPLVDLSLTGSGLVARGMSLPVRNVRLTAQGPLSRLPFQASVEGATPVAYAFEGGGVLSEIAGGRALTLEGRGSVREIAFRTLAPVRLTTAGAVRTVQARLGVGGGEIALEARQTGEGAGLTARLAGLDLGVASEELAGRINGTLALQGRGSVLTGAADLTLDDARNRDAPGNLSLDGRLQAVLSDSRLRLEATAFNAAGLRANATAVLPVVASAAPLRLAVARTQPISGEFAAQGQLQPLWDVFFGGERSLQGQLVAQGRLAGTLNDPRVTGTANVSAGRFEDAGLGLVLQGVDLATELNGDSFFVRRFAGRDDENGRVEGSGEVSLRRNGAGSFRLALTRFEIFDTDQGNATASGEATLIRANDGALTLRGALVVDRAEITPERPSPRGVVQMDVIERNVPAGLGARSRAPAARGPGVALDVTIDAPRGVFVRGENLGLNLDVELSLDARVGGTTTAPQLSGRADVVRGDFNFAGQRFEFSDRGVIFLDEEPRNIRLNLEATRESPTLTAGVRVRGTAANPDIQLFSTPNLPQDEILSQVLFGRSASQLSPIEAAQLASSLSAIATGGGFDVIGGLRNFAGLDRLTFAGGGNDGGGVTVAGGRYLTDDIYLEIIGGGREGPAAQVEWRVRRNLAILSRLGGESGTRLAIRYRRAY